MRKMISAFIISVVLSVTSVPVSAQSTSLKSKIEHRLNGYFHKYDMPNDELQNQSSLQKLIITEHNKTIAVIVSNAFSEQEFTPTSVKKIYHKVKSCFPKQYKDYSFKIMTNDMTIEDLIPNLNGASCAWGDINYDGEPWVQNVSIPYKITHGLWNRHISLWQSHGRYYDQKELKWKWQRPNLFSTNEDLFTQTIVVPYLIPMLENAGAVVFTPRERDWQTHEIIIDNDDASHSIDYIETNIGNRQWQDTPTKGFKRHDGNYHDAENPFFAGSARMINATSKDRNASMISYQPSITEAGRYAVYVSYQTMPNSVDDAHYTVYHKGQATHFRVNQQMGGGTWVYLGTFSFDKGCNQYNRVVLTNKSSHKGVVTADAVRFGGGMGNIERGGETSGLPRTLEGARYSAQWFGAPYTVYSSKNGSDDYGDDINSRSLMTNWLGGGSVYMPSLDGKRVPFELSLAIHSDAGYSHKSDSIVGSLAICTTNFNDGKLNAGISRNSSHDFAESLLSGVYRDLTYKYKKWNRRDLFDKNYSETRLPEVPSSILETLSHQNFNDMRYGQDPNFKFTMARSIYKSILRYVAQQHGRQCIIQPLTPEHFAIEQVSLGTIKLKWSPAIDMQEPSSRPTSYILYMSTGTSGFDNGTMVKGTSCTINIEPGVQYNFRVSAVNRGGVSFPSETLAAITQPNATKTVLVVNGFHRLASPTPIDNDTIQGFNFDDDPGVPYGIYAGWVGKQRCFDKKKMGKVTPDGLGYSDDEWAGHFIVGNTFDYVVTHTQAIGTTNTYNVVSCSAKAVESGMVSLNNYNIVDLIIGQERNDGYSLESYKTFTPTMQRLLTDYTAQHGNLLISGSYIGSDMTSPTEQAFLTNTLKVNYVEQNHEPADSTIIGLGTSYNIYRSLNDQHYACTSTDVITPVAPAFATMQYASGKDVAIAYDGTDYRCITMAFPFECIKSEESRKSIMKGLLNFLSK